MTFIIGCTTDLFLDVNAAGFLTNVFVTLGDPNINIYTIPGSIIVPNYCSVTSYTVINLQKDGVVSTGDIFNSASCGGT